MYFEVKTKVQLDIIHIPMIPRVSRIFDMHQNLEINIILRLRPKPNPIQLKLIYSKSL